MCFAFGIMLLSMASVFMGYKLEKNYFNHLSIFGIVWFIVTLFSVTNSRLYSAEDTTYLIILFGVFFFLVGYSFSEIHIFKHHFSFVIKFKNNNAYRSELRYAMIYGISVALILFYLFELIQLYRSINTLDLGLVIRHLYSDDNLVSRSRVLNALYVLIIAPLSIALPCVTAADVWFGNRDRRLVIFTVIVIAMKAIRFSNRSTIVMFILYLVFAGALVFSQEGWLREKTKSAILKRKRMVILFGLVAVLAFFTLTILRGQRTILNFYTNFSIAPKLFEIWYKRVEENGLFGYGAAGLFGFIYPLFYLFKNLIGIPIPELIQNIFEMETMTENQWMYTGKYEYDNAYVTAMWYGYYDFRLVGVCVLFFLFGFIAKRAYMSVKKSGEPLNVAINCIIMNAVFNSFVRFQFGRSDYALAMFYLVFVLYKKRQME